MEKQDQDSLDPQILATPTMKKKGTKRGKAVIISESQVRRSTREYIPRIKVSNQLFVKIRVVLDVILSHL